MRCCRLVGVVIEPALEQRSADSSINAPVVAKTRLDGVACNGLICQGERGKGEVE